jgi:hypothetical protein
MRIILDSANTSSFGCMSPQMEFIAMVILLIKNSFLEFPSLKSEIKKDYNF